MRRNKNRIGLIFVLILLIFGYFFIYRPIVNIKAKVNIVMTSAKRAAGCRKITKASEKAKSAFNI